MKYDNHISIFDDRYDVYLSFITSNNYFIILIVSYLIYPAYLLHLCC